jgi:hypothetical protein
VERRSEYRLLSDDDGAAAVTRDLSDKNLQTSPHSIFFTFPHRPHLLPPKSQPKTSPPHSRYTLILISLLSDLSLVPHSQFYSPSLPAHILAHPFISLQPQPRLLSQPAHFHVFISHAASAKASHPANHIVCFSHHAWCLIHLDLLLFRASPSSCSSSSLPSALTALVVRRPPTQMFNIAHFFFQQSQQCVCRLHAHARWRPPGCHGSPHVLQCVCLHHQQR